MFPQATGPILAHRLDQPTSGLLLTALHPTAHRGLRLQFEARSVFKRYEAILVGHPDGDQGTIALPFRLDVDRRPHQIYDPVHGKLGVSGWQVLSRYHDDGAPRTRVSFEPQTGRTHQLRVHAAHPAGLGCPIAGDALYGDPHSAPRLLLHAAELRFVHPRTRAPMSFFSPAPF
jgi:tRNA pseudouridine32 synthase/23S rRNA pseudouridine746 synthase